MKMAAINILVFANASLDPIAMERTVLKKVSNYNKVRVQEVLNTFITENE